MSGFGFPAPATAQAVEVLRAQGVVDDGQRDRLLSAAQVPWWLMLLQTLAAWVASLLILSSFMLPLSLLVDHALVRALAGVALCAVAVVLFRRERLFTAQMALAFSLAGQALVVSATRAAAAGPHMPRPNPRPAKRTRTWIRFATMKRPAKEIRPARLPRKISHLLLPRSASRPK